MKDLRTKNPAEAPTLAAGRARVPMTAPQRKLELPDLPGYKVYWFRGDPGRLQRALRAGYEFITPEEVDQNNFDLAGDASSPGQTDMGNRVSVAAQDGADERGQFLRLYAMKIKLEYWNADQEQYEKDRIDPFVRSLTAGRVAAGEGGELPGDTNQRYRRATPLPKMFIKKPASDIKRT